MDCSQNPVIFSSVSAPPVYYKDRNQLILGAAAFLISLMFIFMVLAALALHHSMGEKTNPSIVMDLSAGTWIALTLLGIQSWLKVDRGRSKQPAHITLSLKISLVILLLVLAISGLTDYLIGLGVIPANPGPAQVRASHGIYLVLLVASICLIGPLAEEILIRRLIYNAFRMKFGFPVSNIFCSVLFALLHFSLGMFIPLFLVNLALTWLYQRTGRLAASYVVHASTNAVTVIAAWSGFQHPR